MANVLLRDRERGATASASRASMIDAVGKRPLLGAALEFLVQPKPRAAEPPAEHEAKPSECAKCASKATEASAAAKAGGGCAHNPSEVCASCHGKRAKPAEHAGCGHNPFEACTACAGSASARESGEGDDATKSAGGGASAGGQAQGALQVSGDCEPCKAGEVFARSLVQRTQLPAEGERPREDGWWTGSWYTSTNTVICDGGGSMTINEATNYPYGVQECSVKHENVHKQDWYDRYGADVCKGRKKGDLPYYDPPGKPAYAAFLKQSECKAWKVGETCRKEKLAACKDDTCKTEVQGHVDWAATQVKKYCG